MNGSINVNAPRKSYEVFIGRGLLDEAGRLASGAIAPCTAAIVTDSGVDGLYSERLAESLQRYGFNTVKFVFPAGERSKNAETYASILEFLAESGLTRTDAVFALGGGVTGDLAGFAAATYLRGIAYAQLPTTLLAAVDSSVGGKTGIDLKAGKNLAGAFWQPELVVCDVSALDTLSAEHMADGWAEAIKYGMICDGKLLEKLKGKNAELEEIIARCVEIKSGIVEADEREAGPRRLLNFGHTVGHAVEKCSGYAVSHGRAVAMGMAVITRAAVRKGLCGKDCLDVLYGLLELYALPDSTELEAGELFSAMLADKKRDARGLTLVIPQSVGVCVLKTFDLDEARRLLELGLRP